MTAEMEINAQGEVVKYELYPSVIRVAQRMTYENVYKILVEQDSELINRYQDFVEDFRLMEKLAQILRQKRLIEGAIDFDFQRVKLF